MDEFIVFLFGLGRSKFRQNLGFPRHIKRCGQRRQLKEARVERTGIAFDCLLKAGDVSLGLLKRGVDFSPFRFQRLDLRIEAVEISLQMVYPLRPFPEEEAVSNAASQPAEQIADGMPKDRIMIRVQKNLKGGRSVFPDTDDPQPMAMDEFEARIFIPYGFEELAYAETSFAHICIVKQYNRVCAELGKPSVEIVADAF